MKIIQVDSGNVEATHTHIQYGACVIIDNSLSKVGVVQIRTDNGTAAVPIDTLSPIK